MSADAFAVIEQLFGQLKRQTQCFQGSILAVKPTDTIDTVQTIKKSAQRHDFMFGGYVDLSYATYDSMVKMIVQALHDSSGKQPVVLVLDATNQAIDNAVYQLYEMLVNSQSIDDVYDKVAPNRIEPIPGFGIKPHNWLSVIGLEAA